MPTFLSVMAARIRALLRPGDLDRDFDQELEAHLAMAEEDKIRQGMTRAEGRRTARVELGGLTQLREASREARGVSWLGGFGLDVKLGLRILRKSWRLTLVAGLAMTVVIGIGAFVFDLLNTVGGRSLPLDDGDRVVAIQTWDTAVRDGRGTSLQDFERWRDELRSVEDVGAFRMIERNLFTADGPAEPVSIAEMTASGFQLARVPPLLGRPLIEDDERDGAVPVVVIGYDVWQSRFASDPAVVGQRLRLGSMVHTVVGVMPEDFGFPVYHRFWIPLRADPSDYLRDGEPEGLVVFARLAPGVTLDGAQAELTTIGLLPPAAVPETNEQLQPRVVPYTIAFTGDVDRWMVRLILFLVTLLLIPPCANIAILVYARTVTRQREFAARYALGASRGRIVVQLFVEALVLATGAGGVALVLARQAVWVVQSDMRMRGALPFWMDFSLSFETVLFVAGLAVLAAMIAGGVPALQATGRRMQSGLRSLGSPTRLQLGTTWTALVVVQVAFSFALLPSAVEMTWGTLRLGILGPGFAANEFLTARLAMGWETPPSTEAESGQHRFASRFADAKAELVRQLEAEPGVLEVTVAVAVPGEEPWATIELDEVPLPGDAIFESYSLVRFNQVDDVFFDVFDVQLLTGRRFEAGDFEPARTAVIVNRTFVEDLVGDGNPLGRRVRYIRTGGEPASESEPWYEIVGVVTDLRANTSIRTMYHPAAPGQMHPVSLALRVGSNPARVADRLREITAALDPALRVDEIRLLDEIYRQQAVGNYLGAFALVAVALSVLLLSAAGMYALMSFTLNQRRREIGIRSALGAQPRLLLAGIFGRALGQVAVGAVFGILVALLLGYYLPVEEMGAWNVPGVLPASAAFMIVVGLLGAVGPSRRALRVEPTEALRDG